MLTWIFGNLKSMDVHVHTHDRAAGFIEWKRARVLSFLSINEANLPVNFISQGKRTYRCIEIEELEF